MKVFLQYRSPERVREAPGVFRPHFAIRDKGNLDEGVQVRIPKGNKTLSAKRLRVI